jgi:26S proteasome regulatory subunit N1
MDLSFCRRQAGAILATGLLHAGIRTEVDAAFALLSGHLDSSSVASKVSAVIGFVRFLLLLSFPCMRSDFRNRSSHLIFSSIGLAYAGAHRQDLLDTLAPLVAEDSNSMEVVSMTALALGHIYVGSANGEIAETILTAMSERSDEQLNEKWSRFMALGLALLYVGASKCPLASLHTEAFS